MSLWINDTRKVGIQVPVCVIEAATENRCSARHERTDLECSKAQGHCRAHIAQSHNQVHALWDPNDGTAYPLYFDGEKFPVEPYVDEDSGIMEVQGCKVWTPEGLYRCNTHTIPGYHAHITDQLYAIWSM